MPQESDAIFCWNNRTYFEVLALRSANQRAIDHITNTLATMTNPDSPEADALRVALGILLGATTEATS